jgi:hypothetical protein
LGVFDEGVHFRVVNNFDKFNIKIYLFRYLLKYALRFIFKQDVGAFGAGSQDRNGHGWKPEARCNAKKASLAVQACDDYAGYKQLMNAGVTEAGCLAHAGSNPTSCGPTKAAR